LDEITIGPKRDLRWPSLGWLAAAAAAGLILATGIRLLRPYFRRPTALVFAALAFAGLAAAKLPLLIVVLGLVPLSIAFARRVPA